jgi:hypothetical protein
LHAPDSSPHGSAAAKREKKSSSVTLPQQLDFAYFSVVGKAL